MLTSEDAHPSVGFNVIDERIQDSHVEVYQCDEAALAMWLDGRNSRDSRRSQQHFPEGCGLVLRLSERWMPSHETWSESHRLNA